MAELVRPDQIGHAATQLTEYSYAYADERDRLLRQNMGLDAALLGTAAVAIINPLFDGATRSTLALGLGAGGLGVSRTYLGGPARARAYHNGAAAMSCGAGVSEEFQGLEDLYTPAVLAIRLDANLTEARSLPTSDALRFAIERAARARADLEPARRTLETAHLGLRTFARTVVRNTTHLAYTGTMDFTAARALVDALAGGADTRSGQTATITAAPAAGGPRTLRARSAAEVIAALEADSATAARFTVVVTEVNKRLATCLLQP